MAFRGFKITILHKWFAFSLSSCSKYSPMEAQTLTEQEDLRGPCISPSHGWIFSVTFDVRLHERSSKIPECMKTIDLEQRQNQTLARLIETDFSDSAISPRYWENSIALVCDVPEPLGLSPALFQQLLKGFLQVPRCIFASQAQFWDILPLWSYLMYQALCFPSWISPTFCR